jgi:hypothetical protein
VAFRDKLDARKVNLAPENQPTRSPILNQAIEALIAAEQVNRGRVPSRGVGAVDKWPAVATVQSLAEAGHLSAAVIARAGWSSPVFG